MIFGVLKFVLMIVLFGVQKFVLMIFGVLNLVLMIVHFGVQKFVLMIVLFGVLKFVLMIVLFGVLNFADVIAITDMDHNFPKYSFQLETDSTESLTDRPWGRRHSAAMQQANSTPRCAEDSPSLQLCPTSPGCQAKNCMQKVLALAGICQGTQ